MHGSRWSDAGRIELHASIGGGSGGAGRQREAAGHSGRVHACSCSSSCSLSLAGSFLLCSALPAQARRTARASATHGPASRSCTASPPPPLLRTMSLLPSTLPPRGAAAATAHAHNTAAASAAVAAAGSSAAAAASPALSSSGAVMSLSTLSPSRLSPAELAYLSAGVSANLRADGRARLDYRAFSVETGVVPHANGSARLRLGEGTDVMAAVNLSMIVPEQTASSATGSVACTVEHSAACAVDLDDRAVATANAHLTAELQRIITESGAFPLRSLVIIPDKQVWLVNIDVLLMDNGGNLIDAIVMAVKAALLTTTYEDARTLDARRYASHCACSHCAALFCLLVVFQCSTSGDRDGRRRRLRDHRQ